MTRRSVGLGIEDAGAEFEYGRVTGSAFLTAKSREEMNLP